MTKRFRGLCCLGLCGLLAWLLADAGEVRAWAAEALALCARSVIPSLFPCMVVSGLLVSLGLGELASPWLSGLMALFRLPGSAGSALLLGFAGGYPIGAKTASELFGKGLLTREEAERLLTFANNSNPVFFLSVLGSGVFGSVRTGVWLWLLHILSALLTGLFFRGRDKTARRGVPGRVACRAVSLPAALVEAVRSGAGGMLSVCAFVVFFYVLARPLAGLGGRIGTVLVGVTELFSFTAVLPPDRFGFIAASGCAGWGGISVLCQTLAVLEGSGLNARRCLCGKAVQGVIAAALASAVSGWIFP